MMDDLKATHLDSQLDSHLDSFTSTVHRRHLTIPLLLLLAGHRPLTFFAGQLLYGIAPLCALLGWQEADAWAALLSAPNANQQLTTLLATAQKPRQESSGSLQTEAK